MGDAVDVQDALALTLRVQELERKLLKLSTLYNVSRALSLSLLTENLLDITGAIFADVFATPGFVLYLDDPDERMLYPVALHQTRPGGSLPRAVPREHAVLGPALRGEACVLDATAMVRDWPDAPAALSGGDVCLQPLLAPDGTPLGVMAVAAPADTTAIHELFADIAGQVAIAIENARYIEHARELSLVDPLTGLYNRRYADDRLDREIARAARYGRTLSLAVIDVDCFKPVNDTFGHDVGDRVLKHIAQTLRHCLRQADVVARYGGDEFVVVLPETGRADALRAVTKVVERLASDDGNEAQALGGRLPTLSIGLATFPEDASTRSALFRMADRAMYRAKASGGGCALAADAADAN